MRLAPLVLAMAAAGCGFSPSGAPDDGDGGPRDARTDGDPVPTDAPIDTPTDASFDLERCPSEYNLRIGTSRYRMRGPIDTYAEHYEACASHERGLTHMVVLSSEAEAEALRANRDICNPGVGMCPTFWTGVYRYEGSVDFTNGTGETGVYLAWDSGQPEDIDEMPVGVTYNPGVGRTSDQSIDTPVDSVRALCECDGRMVRDLPPFPR